MAEVFGIGVSGLRAFQRALATTSHNVANASTDGYSRQRTEFETQSPQDLAYMSLGSGVDVAGVARVYDDFLTAQVREVGSTRQQFETLESFAGRVDALLATDELGLSQPMQRFFSAMQDVANQPASPAAREVLLTEAKVLSDRFQGMHQQLTALDGEVNSALGQSVSEVNGLAQEIADINQKLQVMSPAQRRTANDLMDRRDEAVRELAGHVGVKTLMQDDGAMNVLVGSGQALVVGGQASRLAAVPSPFDPARREVAFLGPNSQLNVTSTLSGGRIGGLLEFREQVLDPTLNQVGRLALGLSERLNAQNRMGVDLSGAFGGDLFTAGAPVGLAHAGNAGQALVQVSVLDPAALGTSDYEVSFDGSDYRLHRLEDGSSQVLGAPGPFQVDGMELTIDVGAGAAAAGDRFLVRPTRQAAVGFDTAISDPARFAAAAPVLAQMAPGNLGSAGITPGEVIDSTNPALLDPIEIRFADPPTTFDVVDVGSGLPLSSGVAYTPGADIDANGLRVRIDGAPAAGDVFQIGPNSAGSGDNRNALALAAVSESGYFGAGSVRPGEDYSALIADVGAATRAARNGVSAHAALHEQAIAARESVAGVNLDEEAANLLRFQQAYQAAAEVIGVAENMFQSLLAAVRR